MTSNPPGLEKKVDTSLILLNNYYVTLTNRSTDEQENVLVQFTVHRIGILGPEMYRFDARKEIKSIAHASVYRLDSRRPYVNNIRTEEGYWGNGLMGRLFIVADAYFQSSNKGPLESRDFDRELSAEKVWEKLVKQGLVEEIPQELGSLYRFKPLNS